MMDIIVLDLDGTLLNSRKEISPANYAALERAAAAGALIVPSTGRFYSGMPEAVRSLPFVRYAITVNGAMIYDAKEDKTLYTAELDCARADQVYDYLDTLDVIYDCFQDGWGWMDRSHQEKAPEYVFEPHVLEMIYRLRNPLDNFRQTIRDRGKGLQKIQMFFRDPELRLKMLKELPQAFPDLSVTTSISNNIEINSAGADKGTALRELCRQLNLDVSRSMAFGDGLNDTSMLQAAGIGVAMENAHPDLKAVADHITDSNDSDGVAKAIARFCF